MKTSDNEKVNSFIADLTSINSDKVELIELIRSLFLTANKNLKEDIKYGGLVFMLSGELISGIFPYKAHISIEFSHGVDLADPDDLLEGQGKYRRHLKIFNHQDIETKHVTGFVAEAVES